MKREHDDMSDETPRKCPLCELNFGFFKIFMVILMIASMIALLSLKIPEYKSMSEVVAEGAHWTEDKIRRVIMIMINKTN